MKKLLFALVAAIGINTALQAETLVFEATKDFPDTTSGDVPYYVHNRESALAINAGIEAFRDRFARATTTYSGTGGVYDVTVSALGEIDGECEFRFLVNGVVVATAVNTRVSEDYGVQNHIFEDISIPANAEIAVESNAVSNGLVPEDDIYAFARGRWTTLTLELDEAATTPTVDLTISTEIDNYTPTTGQSVSISYEVFNESTTVTATNPALLITLPPQLTLDQQSQCNITGSTATCALAEISPKTQRTLTVTATASQSGTGQLSTTVNADQQDNLTSNNTSTTEVDVAESITPAVTTVDLSVTATSDVTTANTGDTINYMLTVINLDQNNIATSPAVGVLLPGGMSFSASSDCTATGRSMTCNLAELGVGQNAVVNFSAIANVPGTATIIASVSAAEAEDSVDNNEVLYSISVTDTNTTVAVDPERSNPVPDNSTTSTENSTGGGGSATPINMLLLTMFAIFSWRRRAAQ